MLPSALGVHWAYLVGVPLALSPGLDWWSSAENGRATVKCGWLCLSQDQTVIIHCKRTTAHNYRSLARVGVVSKSIEQPITIA